MPGRERCCSRWPRETPNWDCSSSTCVVRSKTFAECSSRDSEETTMEARELFSELKTFLGFGDDDVARLLSVKPWVEANGRKITDAFYETIQGTPVLAPFVDGRVEKLKQTHTRWMVELV